MAREACFSGVTPGGLSGGEMVRMRQTQRAKGIASIVKNKPRLRFRLHHFLAVILGNSNEMLLFRTVVPTGKGCSWE